MSPSREKTKIAKASQGVEDGPDTKRAKLDSSETTMVKKVCLLRRQVRNPGPYKGLWRRQASQARGSGLEGLGQSESHSAAWRVDVMCALSKE